MNVSVVLDPPSNTPINHSDVSVIMKRNSIQFVSSLPRLELVDLIEYKGDGSLHVCWLTRAKTVLRAKYAFGSDLKELIADYSFEAIKSRGSINETIHVPSSGIISPNTEVLRLLLNLILAGTAGDSLR